MNDAACFSVIGNRGAMQHASGTTLNKKTKIQIQTDQYSGQEISLKIA